ncbi:hypothetical protein [Flavicella sp.]|uniref:hypothetical protein n=1 Tax=Flavicella sp. TaxID=2957742 RepID=UPI00301959CA
MKIKNKIVLLLVFGLTGQFFSCQNSNSVLSEIENEEISTEFVSANLNISRYYTFGEALKDQINEGDGAGIDLSFRNSGVVIDETDNSYYAVNGVHPINSGDYSSYYPKSIVKASIYTDEIIQSYSFSSVNGHDIDMEALCFAENTTTLYIGDEYNYIYELDLSTGSVTREWDLSDLGIVNNIDKGIEAMTYSDGYFYIGIQEDKKIIKLDLNLSSEATTATIVSSFNLDVSPSGLFAHSDGTLYVVSIDSNEQKIYRYKTDGTLLCELSIPSSLNIVRPDGIFIDKANEYVYIADSQGSIYNGYSLYKIVWLNQCN